MFNSRFETIQHTLAAALADAPPRGALAAALACDGPGGRAAWLSGRDAPGGRMLDDPSLRMRVASVTKLAVARAALEIGFDPAASVTEFIDWPGSAPTFGALLSHTSGLTDDAGYLVTPPDPPDAHIPRATTGIRGQFRYANLGYVLLGTAMERKTGRPLGNILSDTVLRPAGIGGGLNWWRVEDRRALPLWQWQDAIHRPTVDGADTDWDAPLVWANGAGVRMADWEPGHAPWFSPQGGLRLSVAEMARLAAHVLSGETGAEMMRPRWTFDGTNGADGNGLFPAYGLGVTLQDDHPALPGRRAGHAGHALGLSGGAWLDRDTGDAWAYALTGQPDHTTPDGEEAFYADHELHVMQALAGEFAPGI